MISDVDDDLQCSKDIAETLETIVKKPYSMKEVKPLSKYNTEYLKKWTESLENMRTELDELWNSHDRYLDESLQLCEFEEEYGKVRGIISFSS